MVIVGNEHEALRVTELLNRARVKNDLIGYISTLPEQNNSEHHLGEIYQLKEIATIYKIDEIIFCSRDVASQQIIEWMTQLGSDLEYKIVPEESISIIGSNSKDAPGEGHVNILLRPIGFSEGLTERINAALAAHSGS